MRKLFLRFIPFTSSNTNETQVEFTCSVAAVRELYTRHLVLVVSAIGIVAAITHTTRPKLQSLAFCVLQCVKCGNKYLHFF